MINSTNSHHGLLDRLSQLGFADRYYLVRKTEGGKAKPDLDIKEIGFVNLLLTTENEYFSAVVYLSQVIPANIAYINAPENQLNKGNIQMNLEKFKSKVEGEVSKEGYRRIKRMMDQMIDELSITPEPELRVQLKFSGPATTKKSALKKGESSSAQNKSVRFPSNEALEGQQKKSYEYRQEYKRDIQFQKALARAKASASRLGSAHTSRSRPF